MNKGTHHKDESKLAISKAAELKWAAWKPVLDMLKEMNKRNISVDDVLQFIRSKPFDKIGPVIPNFKQTMVDRDYRIVTDVILQFKNDKLK